VPDQPPIFVINLARQPERRARMMRLLQEMGLRPRIFEATDGRALDPSTYDFWLNHPRRRLLNPGEIGCMISHVGVWRQIVAEGAPCAVVLEDDLCLASTFADVVRAAGELFAPASRGLNGVSLLRLETERGHVVIRNRSTVAVGDHTCHRMLRRGAFRTGAYVVSRAAAIRLVSAAERLHHSIDAEMYDRRRSSVQRLTAHQLVPAICHQAELCRSMIEREPFLKSSINEMGRRIGDMEALQSATEFPLMESTRLRLRRTKQLAANPLLALVGWRRRIIPFGIGDSQARAGISHEYPLAKSNPARTEPGRIAAIGVAPSE
jgi:glycosyl transferase family 25